MTYVLDLRSWADLLWPDRGAPAVLSKAVRPARRLCCQRSSWSRRLSGAGGLHPKSEIDDQARTAPRRLIVEWTTQL